MVVPLSLHLRNFLSYGLEGGDLDLRPIHMACLSGGNGNGKSALVDAMTWALWGRSRAAREDDLLRHGTTDMEVEFEFATNHAVYRVIRKRSLRKSASVAALELAVYDGDRYRAITGNTIADTERTIAGLLRLSYETFINSSLLLQGRADLFTTKRPAERKEILAEILGLSRYETLSEAAREHERDDRAKAENLRMRIAELDRFLAGLPALHEQLAATQHELGQLQIERTGVEARAGELERRAQMLTGLVDSLGRLTERIAGIEREEGNARRLLEGAEVRARASEKLLAGAESIRLQVADLLAARQENDRLGRLVAQLRELEARAAEAKQVIAAEEARIRSELRAAEASLVQARASVAALATLAPELELARTRHGRAADLQRDRDRVALELEAVAVKIGEVRGTIGSIDARQEELRDKIVTLRRAGAVCPTCGGELDDTRRKEAVDAAMREGAHNKEQRTTHEARERELVDQQAQLQAALAAADKGSRDAQQAGRRQAELEEKARTLKAQADLLPALEDTASSLGKALQTFDYAWDARAATEAIAREAADLGYSKEAHDTVLARVRVLAPAEAQLEKLDAARGDLQRAAIERTTAQAQLDALAGERSRIVAEMEPLKQAVTDLPGARAALQEARATLSTMRAAEESLQQRVGGLRNQQEEAARRAGERAASGGCPGGSRQECLGPSRAGDRVRQARHPDHAD